MNALEWVEQAAYHDRLDTLGKRILYAAYLQLHADNPGLHPDDYLSPDGGYGGWHVLLVDRVMEADSLPDKFHYPCWLLDLRWLDKLEEWHLDDEDDLYTSKIKELRDMFASFNGPDVPVALEHLEALVMFHDGAPMDVFEKLSDACEVYNWLKQF